VFLFLFFFLFFFPKKEPFEYLFVAQTPGLSSLPPFSPCFSVVGGSFVPADRYTWRGIRGYKRLDLKWKTHLLSQLSPLPFTQERDSKKKKKKNVERERKGNREKGKPSTPSTHQNKSYY
jgi:hypothetical protein